ncbi:MAG TPA: M48 family metalloprotease [Bryobacteraceae bacterium]|nr:M48 family metalloprotease [Bryobacteraceae bacterium]
MATATSFQPPGLVFRRVTVNRFKTWFIVGLTVVSLVPFVGGVSYGIASSIVVRARPQSRTTRADIRKAEAYLRSAAPNMDYETRQAWEQIIERKRAALERDEAGSGGLLTELVALFTFVQMGGLGLLFWSIAASPTAKLLVEAGASPAGAAEKEARDLLETLAFSAGLPAPKLFIIESSMPNAFAAGIGPQQSVVAVTRGALLLFDQRELEAVLAHEISHIGNQDVQLNAVVAAIALFLRIPYLLFQRQLQAGKQLHVRKRRSPWRLALSPVGAYILFVAPVVGAVIRAAVSRGREFQADADTVKLTGSPQGLLRALAKIGGSGSTMAFSNPAFAHFYFASPAASSGWLGGSLMATHPPLADRIQMLAEGQDPASIQKLKDAIEAGRRYTREHPLVELGPMMSGGAQDELASFNRGNPMGRVYRVLAMEPVPVYETPNTHSPVLTRVKPGSLLVGFDDPGKMRQVNTAEQTFGYIDRSIKLAAMDPLVPEEVYDPASRAAAEAALPPLNPATGQAFPKPPQSLTRQQILIAVGLGVVVFGGMFVALLKFGN